MPRVKVGFLSIFFHFSYGSLYGSASFEERHIQNAHVDSLTEFETLLAVRLGPAVVHCFGKQQPESLPKPIGLKPETLHLKPQNLNLKPETLNPKPAASSEKAQPLMQP